MLQKAVGIYYRTLPSLRESKEPSLRSDTKVISEINWLWEVRSGERAFSRQRKESACKTETQGTGVVSLVQEGKWLEERVIKAGS